MSSNGTGGALHATKVTRTARKIIWTVNRVIFRQSLAKGMFAPLLLCSRIFSDPNRTAAGEMCRRGDTRRTIPQTSSYGNGVTLHGERAGKGWILFWKCGNAGLEAGMLSTWHTDGRLEIIGGFMRCNSHHRLPHNFALNALSLLKMSLVCMHA